MFRGKEKRADWVWVRRAIGKNQQPSGLNGKILARLNTVFRFRGPKGIFWLAHVTMTKCVGSPTPSGEEGMVRVKWGNNAVVKILDIEGMAHLINIDEGLWLVNNRIELDTWENIHDGQ